MRTLTDLATMVSAPILARAIEAAEKQQLFDLNQLKPNSPGLPALRAQCARPPSFTRSDFEAMFVDLCDRHGIPRPRLTNHQLGPMRPMPTGRTAG